MRKIFFHIGFPKTATTSLQAVFSQIDNVEFVPTDITNKIKEAIFINVDKPSSSLDEIVAILEPYKQKSEKPLFVSNEGFVIRAWEAPAYEEAFDVLIQSFITVARCLELEPIIMVSVRDPLSFLKSYFTYRSSWFYRNNYKSFRSLVSDVVQKRHFFAFYLDYGKLITRIDELGASVISYRFEHFLKNDKAFYNALCLKISGTEIADVAAIGDVHEKKRENKNSFYFSFYDVLFLCTRCVPRSFLSLVPKPFKSFLKSIKLEKKFDLNTEFSSEDIAPPAQQIPADNIYYPQGS